MALVQLDKRACSALFVKRIHNIMLLFLVQISYFKVACFIDYNTTIRRTGVKITAILNVSSFSSW